MTTLNPEMLRRTNVGAKLLIFSFLLFFWTFPLLSQEIILKGRVTDPDGNALPNAAVVLIDRNQIRGRAATGPDGLFKIELHSAGQFVIKVDATGFRPVEQPVRVLMSGN